jgi:hypothetical protein
MQQYLLHHTIHTCRQSKKAAAAITLKLLLKAAGAP